MAQYRKNSFDVLSDIGIPKDLVMPILEYLIVEQNMSRLNLLIQYYSFGQNKILNTIKEIEDTAELSDKWWDIFLDIFQDYHNGYNTRDKKHQMEYMLRFPEKIKLYELQTNNILEKLYFPLDTIFYDQPFIYLATEHKYFGLQYQLIGAANRKYITYEDVIKNSWPYFHLNDENYTMKIYHEDIVYRIIPSKDEILTLQIVDS